MTMGKKLDTIELIRAYMGVGLVTWWGIWANSVHGIPFVDITGFISSLGGLL